MKFRFSTTAIAMCVALGLTACGSSGGGNDHSAAKTEVSNPSAQTQPSTQNPTQSSSAQTEAQSSTQTQTQPSTQIEKQPSTQNSDNSWRKQYIVMNDWSNAEFDSNGVELKGNKSIARGGGFFYHDKEKKNEIMDFDKLSGGKQGYFEGALKPEISGVDRIDYAFINQPYSTYGVASDNQHIYSTTPLLVAHSASSPLIMTGSATYKGQVIGSLGEYQAGGSIYEPSSKPALDGTAELKVKFNGNHAMISGELNTNLVGKIILPEIQSQLIEKNGLIQFISITQNPITHVEKFKNVTGSYQGAIGGENANDIIGNVQVSDLDTSTLYNGTFGGTKQ